MTAMATISSSITMKTSMMIMMTITTTTMATTMTMTTIAAAAGTGTVLETVTSTTHIRPARSEKQSQARPRPSAVRRCGPAHRARLRNVIFLSFFLSLTHTTPARRLSQRWCSSPSRLHKAVASRRLVRNRRHTNRDPFTPETNLAQSPGRSFREDFRRSLRSISPPIEAAR